MDFAIYMLDWVRFASLRCVLLCLDLRGGKGRAVLQSHDRCCANDMLIISSLYLLSMNGTAHKAMIYFLFHHLLRATYGKAQKAMSYRLFGAIHVL